MNRIIKTKIKKSGYRQKFIADFDNELHFKILVKKDGPIIIAFSIHVTLCPQSLCYMYIHVRTQIYIRKCNKNQGCFRSHFLERRTVYITGHFS